VAEYLFYKGVPIESHARECQQTGSVFEKGLPRVNGEAGKNKVIYPLALMPYYHTILTQTPS
jgi:hypothetical protein